MRGSGPGSRQRILTPSLVLVASLLLGGIAASLVAFMSHSRDEARFQREVDRASHRITDRLSTYINLLLAGAGHFSASDDVTIDEFDRFLERFDFTTVYPGIQGVGYTVRVREAMRDSLIAAQRASRFPDFRIWPDSAAGEEEHSIVYLVPLDRRNAAAIGYNMFSESVRREAMSRAAETGRPALSARVTLVQEIEGPTQPGFLIYTPVYRRGATPSTVEARRTELAGFVYAPFRADDLFRGIFGPVGRPLVAFRVYDGLGVDPERLLHDSRTQGIEPHPSPDLRTIDTLEIAGRPWTVTFASTSAFQEELRSLVWLLMLSLGVITSLALFAVTRKQVAARADAEALAVQVQDAAAKLEQQVGEVRELNRQLAMANRAKSEFLAAMSHELRTPLNAIMGHAQLLELGIHGPITAPQRDALKRIGRNQVHLLGLINDILNYAKLEAGKVELRREAVRVAAVLADLHAMAEPLVQERGLTADFAPCDGEIAALADADKMQQILLNLLSNAAKFTEPGGTIRVRCEVDAERVYVRVEDTGRGIPRDRHESIFDPFVQVDRALTRDSAQGVGLGLAISRDLARMMGGELTVRSELGAGSIFTLELPRAARSDQGMREPIAPSTARLSTADPGKGEAPIPPPALSG